MTGPTRSAALFDAIRLCMTEERAPLAREIEQVAAKIWSDAFRRETVSDWDHVAVGSPEHRRSVALARAALGITEPFLLRVAR